MVHYIKKFIINSWVLIHTQIFFEQLISFYLLEMLNLLKPSKKLRKKLFIIISEFYKSEKLWFIKNRI